jgi:hypothetical protein
VKSREIGWGNFYSEREEIRWGKFLLRKRRLKLNADYEWQFCG